MITARKAQPIMGDKPYQKLARKAFPLLVRQAELKSPISYSDLARELGMPFALNLNYVLGSIGRSLEQLSKEWKEEVPLINSLVVKKNNIGIPGKGIGGFLIKNGDFSALRTDQKRARVEEEHQHVFSYRHWREVLEFFKLEPVNIDFLSIIAKARTFGARESARHKALKDYVAKNPQVIGLKTSIQEGDIEFKLSSGDSLDVSFKDSNSWVGVEVKSAISPDPDIMRGFFQCVKYRAVMNAELTLNKRKPNARALLVTEMALPASLIPLKNILRIEVVEEVSPKIR